jgi:hypothetical protein
MSDTNPWECVHKWVVYSVDGKHEYDYCETCGFRIAPKFTVTVNDELGVENE